MVILSFLSLFCTESSGGAISFFLWSWQMTSESFACVPPLLPFLLIATSVKLIINRPSLSEYSIWPELPVGETDWPWWDELWLPLFFFFFFQPRGINATKNRCVYVHCVWNGGMLCRMMFWTKLRTHNVSVLFSRTIYFFVVFFFSFLLDDYFNLYLWKYTTCNM